MCWITATALISVLFGKSLETRQKKVGMNFRDWIDVSDTFLETPSIVYRIYAVLWNAYPIQDGRSYGHLVMP